MLAAVRDDGGLLLISWIQGQEITTGDVGLRPTQEKDVWRAEEMKCEVGMWKRWDETRRDLLDTKGAATLSAQFLARGRAISGGHKRCLSRTHFDLIDSRRDLDVCLHLLEMPDAAVDQYVSRRVPGAPFPQALCPYEDKRPPSCLIETSPPRLPLPPAASVAPRAAVSMMGYIQVGNTDSFGLALFHQLFQLLCLHLSPIWTRPRRMDQEQVHIAPVGWIDQVDRLAQAFSDLVGMSEFGGDKD